jgi:hypothetical protein
MIFVTLEQRNVKRKWNFLRSNAIFMKMKYFTTFRSNETWNTFFFTWDKRNVKRNIHVSFPFRTFDTSRPNYRLLMGPADSCLSRLLFFIFFCKDFFKALDPSKIIYHTCDHYFKMQPYGRIYSLFIFMRCDTIYIKVYIYIFNNVHYFLKYLSY